MPASGYHARMTRALAICVACFLLVGVPGCGQSDGSDVRPASGGAVEPVTLRYDIEGMHCEGCVAAITGKVTGIEGVTACTVSLDDKKAEIKASRPDLGPKIEEAITKLGYKVSKAS